MVPRTSRRFGGRAGGDPRLAGTDFEMPGTNGIELADAFRRARRSGQAILLSAYTVPVVDGAVATRPWLRFMLKPLDYDVLHALIHAL